MLSTDDFILQYEVLPDEELYAIYTNKEEYAVEAQDALTIVLKKRGGLDELIQRLKEKQAYTHEVSRINALATALARQKIDREHGKTRITSSLLSAEEVSETIDRAYTVVFLDLEDRKIKPRTILGSILATLLASALGSIGWGLQQHFAPDLPGKPLLVLFIGLILLCYGIVKLFTRQSHKNVVVLISTVISILLSLFIGSLIA